MTHKMILLLAIGSAFVFSSVSKAQTTSETETEIELKENLRYGGALEFLAPASLENGAPDADRARVRSFEFTAQTGLSKTSHIVAGKLTIGAIDQNGAFTFALREGFFHFGDLLPRVDARVGRFFLPIGLYNQTRHSAYVTSSAPIVVSRLFGDDGIVDTGGDLNWRITNHFELRAGIMNGYSFDSGISGTGAKPNTPTHFARSIYDFVLSSNRNMTVGLNYVGRMSDTGQTIRISGIDFQVLPRTAGARDWLFTSEIFHRYLRPGNLPTEQSLGATTYFEKSIRDPLAIGLRLDAYTITSLADAAGRDRDNLDIGFAPVVTFSRNDFLKFQGAYTFLRQTRDGDSTRSEQVIELRLISELGTIPKFRNSTGASGSLDGRSSL